MEIRLQRWGNSFGIRIPKNILNEFKLNNNDILKLEKEDDKIIITVPKKQKVDLEKLFNDYKGNNLSKEFSWDEPVGREIW